MKNRIFFAIAGILMIASLLPVQAFAADDCSLSIMCSFEDTAIAGAKVKIYRIGDIDRTGQITPTGEFAGIGMYLDTSTAGHLKASASTAYAYAAAGNISPLQSNTGDSNGAARFENLSQGVYLVSIEPVESGDSVKYSFDPFLVSLPGFDSETSQPVKDVTAKPKATKDELPAKALIDISAVKLWEDAGYEDQRPNEVTVVLYRNGQEFDKQTLSRDNGWRFTWNDMDAQQDWVIAEDNVNPVYKVSIDKKANGQFTVTNIRNDIPAETTVQPSSAPNNSPELPKTGLLWWPVPVLCVFGAITLTAGLVIRKKHE